MRFVSRECYSDVGYGVGFSARVAPGPCVPTPGATSLGIPLRRRLLPTRRIFAEFVTVSMDVRGHLAQVKISAVLVKPPSPLDNLVKTSSRGYQP